MSVIGTHGIQYCDLSNKGKMTAHNEAKDVPGRILSF